MGADLSEQGVIALFGQLSGRKTQQVGRLCAKEKSTETQRRRAWVDLAAEPEQKGKESRNEPVHGTRNEPCSECQLFECSRVGA